MTAIVTTQTRTFNAEQVKSSFVSSAASQYIFIGKPTEWDIPNIPDTPTDSLDTTNSARRDMLALKRITESDVALAIYRRNWAYGKYYDFYRHDYGSVGVSGVEMDTGAATAPSSLYETNFFVINDQYDVYKCLWNASGSASTVQPTGHSTSEFTTADGYVWKYMYTLSTNDVVKFVTSDFIPVSTLTANPGASNFYYDQWLVQTNAIAGRINRAIVTNQGSGYPASTTIPVTITGDGVGATATALVNAGGQVTSVTFTNPGTGYTWATASFSGGSNAAATIIISPGKGHGSDAVSELGGYFVVVNSIITPEEGGGDFIAANEYRKIGIIRNPDIFGTSTKITSASAKAYYEFTMASVVGTFAQDETVTGTTSGATGTVLNYSGSDLSVFFKKGNIGTFQSGETVTGTTSGATGTISVLATPEVDVWSGEIIYIEHRLPVSRQAGQQEDVKVVIEC